MNSLLRSWKGSKTCITMYTRRSMKWSESPRNGFQSGTKSYDDTPREKLRIPILPVIHKPTIWMRRVVCEVGSKSWMRN